MRKLLIAAALATSLTGVGMASVDAAPPGSPPGQEAKPSGFEVYTVELSLAELDELRSIGYDIQEDTITPIGDDLVSVDIIMSKRQAASLEGEGKKVGLKRNVRGETVTEAATLEADNGYEVWRSWSEPNGIRDEILTLAEQYPHLIDLKVIGQSVQGQDILALQVTADADRVPDGKRPAVLYASAQHAREWITVETNMRLLRYYLSNYNLDPEVTEILQTTELWFLPVANPDGYDYTFTEGNRLWRKNLADLDGDGVITAANDGVDLNRNFDEKWGYDNEGSSDQPSSNIYRGPSPNSEPETQAYDSLMSSIDFTFLVNYHSAAELLLYGVGWQVATPTPDDNIMAALAGTDDDPAVPGYDPDLSAELYTTNGTTDDQAHGKYGILGYTPELDTCLSAESIFPDDEYGPGYCASEGRTGFEFPDDEELVQAVFEKNLEFALNVAKSAADPTNPVTNTGLSPAPMVVDSFDVSHGSSQEIAVETQREYRNLRMLYSINGGREVSVRAPEWGGGETYGADYDTYYAEYRGVVEGQQPGDEVTVRFTAKDVTGGGKGDDIASEPFTYTVETDGSATALILANEDYLGFGPQQPGVTAPLYVEEYAAALEANGVPYEVWDVTARGVPHDLGVLSHYDLVVWELGDNRLTQEEEDVLTSTFAGTFPDLQVAELQQYLTISVRDYLNEGGKVFYAGEYAGYYGFFGDALGGAYYGINGDPEGDCVVTTGFFSDCLIFSNDFAQYYLGVWSRQGESDPELVEGIASPFDGVFPIDGSVTPDSGSFTPTSEILPPEDFPQFASEAVQQYTTDGPPPFGPYAGEQYAAALHADAAWMRLSRTIDLTGATSARYDFQMSYLTEGGYDHVIVEVREVGTELWTTLPDLNGGTSTDVPFECEAGFFAALHPDLANYLTIDAGGCLPTGDTGEWNSFTGSSGGWTSVAVDLSAYAGSEVEVAISYVTDPASSGIGVFVDEAFVTVDGTAGPVEGFETGLGDYTVPGAPATSPGNGVDWIVSTALFDPPAAAVVTDDTVTFGYGFEAIATPEDRAAAMAEVLAYLVP